MLIKITVINPSDEEGVDGVIKCRDCSIEYSVRDYLTLSLVKKLSYLRIHEEADAYCHECAVKRMLFLKTKFENLIFVLINGEEQKIIDLK